MSTPLYIAKAKNTSPALLAEMANRHGLITGATGTGKTVTLQSLAERFSFHGVPVFLADVKGDLSGMAAAGKITPTLQNRLSELGMKDFVPFANSVAFWDVFSENGIPVRATISEMGPLLFSRLLSLNDTQTGVLQVIFRIADDQGLLLIDLKDLRAMTQYVGDNAKNYRNSYGNLATTSIGAIQRGLLTLETQGGDVFFGEPALDIQDLMRCDNNRRGVINILSAEKLIHQPLLYSTFLLWLLSELFEQLPEVGDVDKPKLVFFFDEAHLLFNDAPAALVDKVEQVVRLIRSKGVGIYFVTQNPMDIPDKVLGQLGNRVQHALRAFTPRDQKAVQVAADTLRQNPAFDAKEVITELGVGEALVSCLDEKGRPSVVERAFIFPPASRLSPLSEAERDAIIDASPLLPKYGDRIDRESAFEVLQGTAAEKTDDRSGALPAPAHAPAAPLESAPSTRRASVSAENKTAREPLLPTFNQRDSAPARAPVGRAREGIMEAAAKSVARGVAGTIGREVGRQILRGVLGSIFGGRR